LIDALEWSAPGRASLIPLFHAWNNDFHVTPVGGEDSLANMQDNRPVGIIRTYARLGADFTVQAWVDAIKQGRAFMSCGPVVDFKVNGKAPGESVSLPEQGKHNVRLEGSAWSVTPLRKALLYHNGALWKEIRPGADRFAIRFSETAEIAASGWFSLVVEADALPPTAPEVYVQAVTNCVRAYVGGGKIRNAQSAAYFLRWCHAALKT
jgi:hypothetical protein